MKYFKFIATGLWRYKFKTIGLLIFLFILKDLDFEYFKSAIEQLNYFLLFAIFMITIPAILLRSLRWKLIVHYQTAITIPYYNMVRYYLIALFWGAISPGKIGEFVKIKYLKDHNIPINHAIADTLLDRILDIICLLLIGLIGFLFYFYQIKSNLVSFFGPVIVFCILSGAFVLKWRIGLEVIDKLFEKIFNRFDRLNLFRPKYSGFKRRFLSYDKKTISSSSVLTVFAWLIYLLQRILFAHIVHLNVSIFLFVSVVVVSAVLTLIPISIQGIGTRDAIFIFLFGKVGVPEEQSVLISTLILLAYMFNAMLGFLTYFFFNKSVKISSYEKIKK